MFTREKIAQAVRLLPAYGLDLWVTLCRETSHMKDPALDLICGGDVVWTSAFLIGRDGTNIALVGKYDAEGIRRMGEFDMVIGYDEDFGKPFLDLLRAQNPMRIGLNFSLDDAAADGLSHGLWLYLQSLLASTPYQDRLTSAAGLIGELRGVKTPGELEHITQSIHYAEAIIAEVGAALRPGLSEVEISGLFKEGMKRHGVMEAWMPAGCPAVNCGPDSAVGHSLPSAGIKLRAGQIVHIDFGVIRNRYASDLQRVWYLPNAGETEAPAEIRRAFTVVREAIVRSAEALRPGLCGYEIDAIARNIVIRAGYPEYMHALGHQVGQKAHDGGSLLGPLWPRYGASPKEPLRAGNVFTLELGVPTPMGYIGLEEMVVIEGNGCRFLSHPQESVWIVQA